MKKTPGASKATSAVGWCKHLRKWGKRLANKASRRLSKGANKMSDFTVRDEGTVVVFQPKNDRALNFTEELGLEPWQRWAGGAFDVHRRRAWQLVITLQEEGFIVEQRA